MKSTLLSCRRSWREAAQAARAFFVGPSGARRGEPHSAVTSDWALVETGTRATMTADAMIEPATTIHGQRRRVIHRSYGAGSELRDLPGVVDASLNTTTGSFDVIFDPVVVSDDELAAALHHQGYELTSWQEVRVMDAVDQRTWLLEQIQSHVSRVHHEGAQHGAHVDAVIRGEVDAYLRTARAFGLVTTRRSCS